MVRTVLDLTGCKTWDDMHERFKVALHFPDYYGCNWYAFEDSLLMESDVTFIEIRGEHTMSPKFSDCLDMMHRILNYVKDDRQRSGWDFDYVIVD